MTHILLVDHTTEVFKMVQESTGQLGELNWVRSIKDAREEITKNKYDIILLDVDFPDGNGMEFCASIQATHSEVSIFFLTEHNTLLEKIMGFSVGAEDYITKPFSTLELRARLEARIRKNQQRHQHDDHLIWKEIQIVKSRQEVTIMDNNKSTVVSLTALEYKILLYFASRLGEVVVRDQILNDIWGENIHVYSRSVDTHVCKLRKKLGPVSQILESVHGTGYKFNPTSLSNQTALL